MRNWVHLEAASEELTVNRLKLVCSGDMPGHYSAKMATFFISFRNQTQITKGT